MAAVSALIVRSVGGFTIGKLITHGLTSSVINATAVRTFIKRIIFMFGVDR